MANSQEGDRVVAEVLTCMKRLPEMQVPAVWQQRYQAWGNASQSDIAQSRNNGFGGGETRKLTLTSDGSAVCVHVFAPKFGDIGPVNSRFKTRLRQAHAAIAAAGLAAPRFGEWDNGFVEPWLNGGAVCTPGLEGEWHRAISTVSNADVLGRLLAQIHSVDSGWFDEFREGVMAAFPQLAKAGVDKDSYLWRDAGMLEGALATDPPLVFHHGAWLNQPGVLEMFQSTGPFPVTEAAKAIVTTHGDYHPGNMLIANEGDHGEVPDLARTGVMICDFENAGTGPAVADLTYALGFFLSNTWGTEVQHAVYNRGPLRTPELALRLRQAVCRGYLRELGRPAGEEDVFALLLDVERCSLRFSRPEVTSLWASGNPPLQLPTLHGWWFDAEELDTQDVALVHAARELAQAQSGTEEDGSKFGGDVLGEKYMLCLEIADRALSDRGLAEEIVTKGFRYCDAVRAVCERFRPPAPSTEPTGRSAGKSAREIAVFITEDMRTIPEWRDPVQKWAQDLVEKGEEGMREAVFSVASDVNNSNGIKFISDDLRAEIRAEMLKAGFERVFKEGVAAGVAQQQAPSRARL